MASKAAAHSAVFAAIKRGDLVRPSACELCGLTTRRIIAHHPDYSKPLDVMWIDECCHRLIHSALKREAAA